MLWHILHREGSRQSGAKTLNIHILTLYKQTLRNISSKLFLVPLCTLIHLHMALNNMNKCFLSIFATFCNILFTDMLTNNNYISTRTNKPHSDLNMLTKTTQLVCVQKRQTRRWFTSKPACGWDVYIVDGRRSSRKFQEVLLLFLVRGLLGTPSSS